ncbi:ribonuclease T2 [Ponticoccus sp. SC2-23]|uniref:ribonuclease T2 family protein n=1 Tax=Alexandriicola marinus TaxID=2081710 RepID=UPI000FD8B814|nr:ribonuclease T2 [Alexandriicola marinus]MBM1222128.1 ribonuclease T2 [Ponticoccus sp. SC6-9]MBM1226815.1 ribonuclease T2 [Ponticoccus sp. SC6-15]MBM1231075.1 ribonuclease T2 [Ponticoccus sp. SC6-38]MBM1235673.1 ribonuclease T2 [Ponticoccus sp. SC6-45]MBM1240097.1 ribonuclease T2 [Ponticoccus sp. SC6-49]MBM1244451.1 ribonuclease T2 [Ponticoccus sp. SC2-64]MBM1249147.1 ribonuclease T2 [Ponticoccus sp. SC6-42]MBM1253752.1 ribonuclease T2 [Ponticoccus sp. SC6-33]MBM1258105.1 ribonuclease T2
MRYLLAVFLCLAAPLRAEDTAGEFDYYVMALSWSPNWCEREGDARDSPQCDPAKDFGWVLHGLWPQYERGWPQDCFSPHQPPSRAMTRDMADIMGTSGLAWYQWNKHGSCSGLSPAEYYDLARAAYDSVVRPEVFRRLPDAVRLPAALIEEAFIADNPEITPDGLTVTCRDGYIQEARICLTRDLEFRECGADVVRDCTLDDALFSPVR